MFWFILKVVANATFKTIYWFLGNAVFSVFPLWILLSMKSLNINTSFADMSQAEFTHLMKDGILVFFFCALMGSIVTDMVINDEIQKSRIKNKLFLRFIMIQVPSILLISLCGVYLLITLGALPKDFFEKFSWYPETFIAFSFNYCYVYKLYNFVKEEIKLW